MGQFVDSIQLQFSQSPTSCGIVEAHHFPDHTATKLLFSVATQLYHKANPRPAAFLLFSDVIEDRNISRGARLADLLSQSDFGELFISSKQVNPKTGNVITVWILTIEHEALREWYQDELANRIE